MEHRTAGGAEAGDPDRAARERRLRVMTAVGVAAFYMLACGLPAVELGGWSFAPLGDWHEVHHGWAAALLGWFTPYFLPWVANPLLFAGWVNLLCGNNRSAAALGGVAFVLGLSVWAFVVEPYTIVPPEKGLSGLSAGYYLWQASMLVLIFGAVSAVRLR
jgi:hypothetical protein